MEFDESSQPPNPITKDTSIQSSQPSRRSVRSSSTGTSSTPSPRIVFSTTSYYHPWCYVILSVPLLLILSQILYDVLIVENNYEFQQKAQSWTLVWAFFLIVAIYLMVLPKQLYVRSNGTVAIKTFFLTYRFSDVCRAYVTGWERNDFLRPRLKFATAFAPPHRVVIRRKNGKWDLVVSPTDPEGFVQAVEEMVSKIDELSAWTMLEKDEAMGDSEQQQQQQQQHPDMALAQWSR